MNIRKLLVANRGEIAVRVFATCRRLGIATVAVHAPDDEGAFHTRRADETAAIASYLDPAEPIRAALETGADAIHPGYGFLAESGDFAEAVAAAGIVFVGPSPEAIRASGDKLEAKRLAREAGVPVVESGEPGELGYPLIVKAAAGGGGRGMRVVRSPGELEEALAVGRSRGRGRVWRRPRLRRALRRAAASRRDPAAGRPARQRDPPRRAGVLDPAPPPEGAGGEPLPRPRPRARGPQWARRPWRLHGPSATRTRAPPSSCWTTSVSSSWS